MEGNELDTDYTRKLKYSNENEVLAKYVIFDHFENEYFTMSEDIEELISFWVDSRIEPEIRSVAEKFSVKDSTNIYMIIIKIFEEIKNDKETLQEIENELSGYDNFEDFERKIYDKILPPDLLTLYENNDQDFIFRFQEWIGEYNQKLWEQNEEYEKVMRNIEKLSSIENNIKVGKVKISKMSLSIFFERYEMMKDNLERGFDIFDKARLSPKIPYIKYRRHMELDKVGAKDYRDYRKVYNGSVIGDFLSLKDIIKIYPDEKQQNDSIYFKHIYGNVVRKISDKNSGTGRIVLDDGFNSYVYFTLENLTNLEEEIMDVMDHFSLEPSLTKDGKINYVENFVNGRFKLLSPVDIDMNVLILMMSANKMINENFFLYEKVNLISTDAKDFRYKFNYREGGQDFDDKNYMSINMFKQYVLGEYDFELEDGGTERLKSNQLLLDIEVRNAKTIDGLYEFINMFSRLILYLVQEDDFYRESLELYSRLGISDSKLMGESITIENFDMMALYFPDIFGLEYSKKAQVKNKRPLLLNKKARKDHKNKIVEPFPNKKNPLFWITSVENDEGFNYPYLIENCEVLSPSIGKDKKRYKDYLEYIKTGEYSKSTKIDIDDKDLKIMRERKAAPFGRKSNLFENLIPVLKRGSNLDTFYRIGVPFSQYSFLHAVLLALDDRYLELENDEERESYAKEVYEDMILSINQNVMKQELYDIDNIMVVLENPKLFFDPKIFYRIVEEYFSINIFTFIPDGPTKGKIEIPRHIYRYLRGESGYQDTVIIYKHWGSDNQNLKYPHCELVVGMEGQEMVKFFRKRMEEMLSEAQEFTYKFYGDEIEPLDLGVPDFQHVNHQGKLIGVNENGISYFFSPRQPLNIPIISEIKPTSYKKATKRFGEPDHCSKEKGKCVGLYFGEIFVPINPHKSELDIPEKSPYSFIFETKKSNNRLKHLVETAGIISNIYRWLFDFFLNKMNADEFINNYTLTGNDEM
ncbi:MAG: hypothetical protein O2U61_05600, partial [Candidatus Bathyarchaeota archaeon]|nr:hypothetical protein [Candidatus Bathyarchaeota archaeon]